MTRGLLQNRVNAENFGGRKYRLLYSRPYWAQWDAYKLILWGLWDFYIWRPSDVRLAMSWWEYMVDEWRKKRKVFIRYRIKHGY